jgi:hypothetical protein
MDSLDDFVLEPVIKIEMHLLDQFGIRQRVEIDIVDGHGKDYALSVPAYETYQIETGFENQ